ncbi:ORF2 [Halorubrum pleomorphic virus 6]|uniref:ORF2 n=1 Tax=Halorubrum pleomorphic virus 6 TaxID=1156721 RepID=H9ABP3_9VIRU|nr:ORF2 [Halorubrum pleomorphic virus 6]AFD04013.1 ORF2 [Halorubrum pleomorphic virus 6]
MTTCPLTTHYADGRRPEADANRSADETRSPGGERAASQLLESAAAQEMKTPGTDTVRKPGSPRSLNPERRAKRAEGNRDGSRRGRQPGTASWPRPESLDLRAAECSSCKTKRSDTRARLEAGATRL